MAMILQVCSPYYRFIFFTQTDQLSFIFRFKIKPDEESLIADEQSKTYLCRAIEIEKAE